ncbi:hypothetical protein [Kaistia sp. UC242_56]|uniref:hypothetical protein n=1 Tax=Kaistia sp. UC242_56 TaxID=3374625 RepID=UPI0037A5DD4C
MRILFTAWRAGLILFGLAVMPISGSALAETPTASPLPPAAADVARPGRYTMVPAEGGFVRLDTETGTVSHCRRGDAGSGSVWTCAAIPEDVLSRPDPAVALSAQVTELEHEVADLRARLEDVEGRANTRAVAPTGDPELDKALNFSEELMSRFFGMVREMKREADGDKS